MEIGSQSAQLTRTDSAPWSKDSVCSMEQSQCLLKLFILKSHCPPCVQYHRFRETTKLPQAVSGSRRELKATLTRSRYAVLFRNMFSLVSEHNHTSKYFRGIRSDLYFQDKKCISHILFKISYRKFVTKNANEVIFLSHLPNISIDHSDIQ
jgi:hypothetical protein